MDASEDSEEEGLCEDYIPDINCECVLPFNFKGIDKLMCIVCGQDQHLACTGKPIKTNSEHTCYRCCVRLDRESADEHASYLDKPQRVTLALTRLIGTYIKTGLSPEDITRKISRKSREAIITAVVKCGIIDRHGKRIVPNEDYEENLKNYMYEPENPEGAETISKSEEEKFCPILPKDISISCLCELAHNIHGIETIQCVVCEKYQHVACLGLQVKPNLLKHTCFSCCKRLDLIYADTLATNQTDAQRYYLSVVRLISIFMLKTGLYPESIISIIDPEHRKTAAVLLKRNGFIKRVGNRIAPGDGYKEAMRPFVYADPTASVADNETPIVADTVENTAPIEISNVVP